MSPDSGARTGLGRPNPAVQRTAGSARISPGLTRVPYSKQLCGARQMRPRGPPGNGRVSRTANNCAGRTWCRHVAPPQSNGKVAPVNSGAPRVPLASWAARTGRWRLTACRACAPRHPPVPPCAAPREPANGMLPRVHASGPCTNAWIPWTAHRAPPNSRPTCVPRAWPTHHQAFPVDRAP